MVVCTVCSGWRTETHTVDDRRAAKPSHVWHTNRILQTVTECRGEHSQLWRGGR